jgi:hypothetical protein
VAKRQIFLNEQDEALAEQLGAAMDLAILSAHNPVAVAKRIVVLAIAHRNVGRTAARKRHEYRGICEASGEPLKFDDAVLDELQREVGYTGPLRWVCPRANNSGKFSCGKCE